MFRLKPLSLEQIKNFASRPGVREIAVGNFLGTVHNCITPDNAFLNLIKDAKLYRWNDATVNAIVDGILAAVDLLQEDEDEPIPDEV